LVGLRTYQHAHIYIGQGNVLHLSCVSLKYGGSEWTKIKTRPEKDKKQDDFSKKSNKKQG